MNKLLLTTCMLALATGLEAQRIDINNSQNRTDDGYTGWTIGTTTQATVTVDGVTVTASIDGVQTGRTLKGEWWKDGVNKYSKLVCDGVGVYGLDTSGNTPQLQEGETGIKLTITGLSAGEHSLLAYHNNPSGYQGPNLKVLVGGQEVLAQVAQTNRCQTVDGSGQSYVKFTAQAGQAVEIVYRTTPDPAMDYTQGYNTTSLFINALVFDRPNPLTTASSPTPAHLDLHANCDGGHCTLSWTPAATAVKHHVLLAEEFEPLQEVATVTTPSYEVQRLDPLKTYFWRIDEEDASGRHYEGDTWIFRPRRLAFPDAEGYGKYAIGGRGGSVYHVTSLDDDPSNPQPGTFRYGITQVKGARTIVFDVAGAIYLKSRLTCSDSYVTIAGQTAPGIGIMLRGAPFGMASDGITRFIRMRRGHILDDNDANRGLDGMGMAGNDHSIMDHCSISWTIDEGFSSRGAKNITLQRTLISEALNIAGHPNYAEGTAHGYAATIGGGENGGLGSSFHHNLLAHNEGRNWSMSGGLDGAGNYDGHHDMFNNVCYNWGHRATDGGTHEGQFVANYYKMGPATTKTILLEATLEGPHPGTQSYYVSGNIRENLNGTKTTDAENETYAKNVKAQHTQQWQVFVDQPFFESLATVEPAEQAFQNVLSDVGCNQPALDNHDERMIRETLTGTTSTRGSKSQKDGIIDHEDEAEGFDGLNIVEESRPANWDTDLDGMPDWYERTMGTDPAMANNNDDTDGNGYTDLEDYLEFMAHPRIMLPLGSIYELNTESCKPLFAGYEDFSVDFNVIPEKLHGGFSVSTMIDGNGNRYLKVEAVSQKIGEVEVVVTDKKTSSTMSRNIYFCATDEASGVGRVATDREQSALPVYGLGGQQLHAPRKGLNIERGRKYMK